MWKISPKKTPALFLVNTWKLLPETNLSLRSGGIYSIRDYRLALQQTDRFFSQMMPEHVFHCYQGCATGLKNIGIRCVVPATTCRSPASTWASSCWQSASWRRWQNAPGGDAPLSLFMGEVRQEGEDVRSLGDFLPSPRLHPEVDPGSIVYNLLETGRASPAEFTDLRNSPLSMFIYSSLGPEGVAAGLEQARAMFDGSLEAGAISCSSLIRELLSAIAEGCAIMVPTRSEKLRRFVSMVNETAGLLMLTGKECL